VLAQCRALVHLDLSENEIGDAGAESFAGVLEQCAALTHLSTDSGSGPESGLFLVSEEEEDEEDAGEIDEDEIFLLFIKSYSTSNLASSS